jgi:hypothetical protein
VLSHMSTSYGDDMNSMNKSASMQGSSLLRLPNGTPVIVREASLRMSGDSTVNEERSLLVRSIGSIVSSIFRFRRNKGESGSISSSPSSSEESSTDDASLFTF